MGKRVESHSSQERSGLQQDMVFASPLSRAKYGAERIAEKHGLEVVLDDRFKEVQRGRWLGKTKEQINEV